MLNDSLTIPSARPILNPVRIKDKGRPYSALSNISRTIKSSTKRLPSSFELPSSSAPATLSQPRSPTKQLFVVHIDLKRPSSTARAMTKIKNGYIDPYEPGTRKEQAYICDISSIYQENNIKGAAIITAATLEDTIVVQVPDTE